MRLTVYFPEDSPTTHDFVGQKLTVGRLGDNDVQLDEGSVSSHHAEVVLRDGGGVLVDKGSTNGTFLNGEQVTGEAALGEGDEIYFGNDVVGKKIPEEMEKQKEKVKIAKFHPYK